MGSAEATSALNHPNILTVHDIGEHEGSPFIVAELLEGQELRERLNEGPISLSKVTEYAQQIISGLSAAHERGVIHRDLKPENIFITKDDRVNILDFGLAKLREYELDQPAPKMRPAPLPDGQWASISSGSSSVGARPSSVAPFQLATFPTVMRKPPSFHSHQHT